MKTFFAINQKNKTVTALPGFEYWELVQNAFRSGILMPDGHTATGIGRCKSRADFEMRVAYSGFTLMP